jgi:DNA-directed RNA polymerase specialized sigma24 family protein
MKVAERDAPAAAADAEVIERSWAESEQFAVLFDRHAPLIHRYAARRIGAEAADDLVAEIAWEQLSYDETARALGIPLGTVRSRLNRARTRLRDALAASTSAETIKEILSNE